MAQQLPKNFDTPAESSVASYNYVDTLEGVGQLKFYGAGIKDSISSRQILTGQIIEPNPLTIVVGSGNNVDFVLPPFNLPKTTKGTGILTFNTVVNNTTTLKLQALKTTGTKNTDSVSTTTVSHANGNFSTTVTILKEGYFSSFQLENDGSNPTDGYLTVIRGGVTLASVSGLQGFGTVTFTENQYKDLLHVGDVVTINAGSSFHQPYYKSAFSYSDSYFTITNQNAPATNANLFICSYVDTNYTKCGEITTATLTGTENNCMQMSFSQVNFKIGESLQLKIFNTGANGATISIDPTGLTPLVFYCPFKLNL